MYDIKYKVGTRFYEITSYVASGSSIEECKKCEGFGYFKTLGTKSKIKCKECDGTGEFIEETSLKWIVNINDYIAVIQIYESGEVIYLDRCRNSINDEIGKTVFFTKKEAELMCDKLNKKIK